jgi:nitrogen fixation protein FixH
MNKKKYIPWLLPVIGGIFLILTTWSIYMAGQGTSAVTDRDYYSHGLRFNETLLERKAAESLGWLVTTELRGHTLHFHLRDKNGTPVLEARGNLEIFFPGASTSVRLPLVNIGSGRYQINLPDKVSGEMSAHLEFERDGARISKQLLLNL